MGHEKVLLEISMSLDGYVAGPDVNPEEPMGRGGEFLHEWMFGDGSPTESQQFERDHFRAGSRSTAATDA